MGAKRLEMRFCQHRPESDASRGVDMLMVDILMAS